MRNQTALQQKIAALTNNGDDILRFLAETMRGEIPGAKACHRMEAARHLMRLDSSDEPEDTDQEESQFWGLIPTPEELAAKKEDQQSPLSPRERVRVRGQEEQAVTYLDILNYEVAHLIRTETADGHTIVKFLADVMNRRDQPFTPKKLRIRQTDRMAAAREIMRRGLGHFGRRRKLVHDDYEADDYDTLHTDLAKRMREYSRHGADVVRFLLDVMSDTSLDPEEAYTWHHRTSAAMELLRRGWDTNYDNITTEMLQAYWRDQQSSRLSVGQKKRIAGLPAFTDEYDQYDTTDYETIAQQLREAEEREAVAEYRHSRENGNPAEQGAGTETTNPFVLSLSKDESASSPDNTKYSASLPSPSSMSIPFNDETNFIDEADVNPDDLDCFVEPLNPDDQAIFDYQTRLEFSDFKEEEITFQPPSEAAWQEHRRLLAQITEAAAAAGVPLLPNPLAGTLRHPTIRSP